MKDIYKNPILYYILAPISVALWPLFIWGIYLPDAEDNWQAKKTQYSKAQKIMAEIITLDPDRLEFADAKNIAAEFDYATAVERIASLCRIPSSNYNISSKPIRTSGGQKSQSAMVILKQVDITRFARFISTIQLRWANLQCEKVTLAKKKGLPDTWKVDLDFKYYY